MVVEANHVTYNVPSLVFKARHLSRWLCLWRLSSDGELPEQALGGIPLETLLAWSIFGAGRLVRLVMFGDVMMTSPA